MYEYKHYPKINRPRNIRVVITQKIDGSNGQIIIQEDGTLTCASRNRVLSLEDDNHGFARWCTDNEKVLVEFLGPGIHYGEWAGPKINSGEGLTERTFVLFSWWERNANDGILVMPSLRYVPKLIETNLEDIQANNLIIESLRDLKENGSKLVPGFMNPEGIVVDINGHKIKYFVEDL